jgi:hypothetical protein
MVIFMPPACRKHFFILCKDYTKQFFEVARTLRVIGGVCRQPKTKLNERTKNNMKKILATKTRSRLRPLLAVAALLTLNTVSAFAQSTTFSSTDLRTGISNSLAVIMMFGFVLGISSVIYGGFAIRRGDVDQGKMSIIGGAIIASAPAVIYAFYKIFGLDGNSSVGIGNF